MRIKYLLQFLILLFIIGCHLSPEIPSEQLTKRRSITDSLIYLYDSGQIGCYDSVYLYDTLYMVCGESK